MSVGANTVAQALNDLCRDACKHTDRVLPGGTLNDRVIPSAAHVAILREIARYLPELIELVLAAADQHETVRSGTNTTKRDPHEEQRRVGRSLAGLEHLGESRRG